MAGHDDFSSNTGHAKTPDGLPPLRDVIRQYDLHAQKALGQNFILDFNLTRRIARLAGPLKNHFVAEVGPGPGGLTRALLFEGAERVYCVERDARCLPALQDIAAHYPDRLFIEQDDALKVDWSSLIPSNAGQTIIAANLPYQIATTLLVGWLETEPWPPWFARMILMFQREVAERIVAEPNNKAYGRLSVLAQWRTNARIVMTLKPEAFTPPPRVASAVILFQPKDALSPGCTVKALSQITSAAFGQRRKMLRQSLKSLIKDPLALLDAANIAPDRRAENLSVREFAHLAYVFEHFAQH